jgi:Pyruvate/2-oxoacid:ferredoxin oxidoreductase delta subunit
MSGFIINYGNGKCSNCHGTGRESFLEVIEEWPEQTGNYPVCDGSGICQNCGGGWIYMMSFI